MPKRMPIKAVQHGSGREGRARPTRTGKSSPAATSPHFKPRPAVVTRISPSPDYLANEPERWQWISAVGDLVRLPEEVTYTFRTTFEISGALPGTAILRGTFLVDDHVNAIRLNGRNVDVPEHSYGDTSATLYHDFTATSGFVEGTNVLEIDVFNGGYAIAEPGRTSFMLLRVKLDGSVLRAAATASDDTAPPTRGKEGSPMN